MKLIKNVLSLGLFLGYHVKTLDYNAQSFKLLSVA